CCDDGDALHPAKTNAASDVSDKTSLRMGKPRISAFNGHEPVRRRNATVIRGGNPEHSGNGPDRKVNGRRVSSRRNTSAAQRTAAAQYLHGTGRQRSGGVFFRVLLPRQISAQLIRSRTKRQNERNARSANKAGCC